MPKWSIFERLKEVTKPKSTDELIFTDLAPVIPPLMSRVCSGYGPVCKFLRGEPVKARMGSVVVVVVTLPLDDVTSMVIAGEQMFVQAFVS